MKKLFAMMITVAVLAACSNEEPKESVESTKPAEETAPIEQASDEVEEGLKADTVEREYAAFADDEVPVNSKVKFLGIVTAINEDTFTVESKADESSDKFVYVKDIRLGERTDIMEGFEVSVYGTYDGKDDENVPVIKGIFIDAD
ncbi:hypothetical protein CSV71_14465 [Sporosarcina sp. P21c]|uniref:hypothetical protein n=1 Tax=Sporosarcina TaxID=1569 RepID=UPI000A15D10E|nr:MULTISPECIES: hypothetical protein [Sporosarcina]ARJ39171.1 hypothetical protein SporoP8_10015 [Sporosarcina ureae]PIC66470.1 hypothetical protein CSV78_12445 [Sporosarcina sp. P16a]PIC88502.1 hypothetical protein CSV71_14465 [Sporosarcina sp. P21c]PIC92062.1 hypothetical protein CSV70_12445 [Sporosarcina sp. P25]